ncbi:TPA: glycosyltransferase family 2 protein [Streptococcus suis]|uniref:glycosyltransferase n=1 Tax=Streptococcus suis TaxID=1307 RepID=UPI0004117ACA|nr:glycosyltransferase family 2 protein [Streptococcus suis]HEM2752178.1 glycosyltransferase family 2 protein [Streptococcus suis]HEM3195385.1 glycosyltransferase family 2 protein [Streptococcus suis 10581]HEM5047675.1 glycosyltransferase family 2 protein [Streptococcus suis]HEM5651447.1 glycosyltransferase family 2 protein [Streptococcus suis]
MADQLKATVFIPVYNGERDHLEETLSALYRQVTDFKWDVLITDSGSSDNSVAIINHFSEKYGNLRLLHLSKEEFSHGKTRQMAAEISQGEIMVYLTQDAVPHNEQWLAEMVRPFAMHSDIVAVLGNQKPRHYCFPAMKYDILAVFNEQGVSDSLTFWQRFDESKKGQYTKESFYSDVCSAAPRKFLIEKIGYRDVAYSEDYEYGKDILDAGYIKVYNSKAIVEHSNDVRLSEYRQRIFDETYNVRLNSGVTNKVSVFSVIKQVLRGSYKDSIKILSDRDYSLKRKLYWLAINPLFHIEKWRGIRQANLVGLNQDVSRYSLEKKRG